MAISEPTVPTPAVPIKREAQPERTQLPTTIQESPLVKRKRFFHEISTDKEKKTLFDAKRGITSPDELSEPELKECYVIARAALQAQFENRKVTSEVMEDFLGLVFHSGWTTNKPNPPVGELDLFPPSVGTWSSPSSVGQVMIDGMPQEVTQRISLSTDPPQLNLDHYRLARQGSKNIQPLSMAELETMSWKSNADVRSSTRKLCRQALISMTNTFATYNRKRAVTYARDFLNHQAQGHSFPLGGRYTFASMRLILNAFPLLNEMELEDSGSTVALFGVAELGEWKGTTARFGSQILKTSGS